jgi:hypothetical protein
MTPAECIEAIGLPLADLAFFLEVDVATLRRWSTDSATPTGDQLELLDALAQRGPAEAAAAVARLRAAAAGMRELMHVDLRRSRAPMLTDAQIRDRLEFVGSVITPAQRIENRIVRVAHDRVVVASARTSTEREIPYDDLRRAPYVTRHGVIVRALARVLGLLPDPDETVPAAPPSLTPSQEPAHGDIIEFYLRAKTWATEQSDWFEEFPWDRDPTMLTEQEFMADYAWAVYCSGFRARALRTLWSPLSKAWNEFEPARMNEAARVSSLEVLGHTGKSQAVLAVAKLIGDMGWAAFRTAYCVNADTLGELPWMGPANKRFLARNLRIQNVAKPDIWMLRLAVAFGFASVDMMMAAIEAGTGDDPGRADAYLWAYMSDNPYSLAAQSDEDADES